VLVLASAGTVQRASAGDDVAPTSLNEGRGEVIAQAFSIVPLGPTLVGGCGRGGGTGRRATGSPNADDRIGAIFGRALIRDFPRRVLLQCRRP
jgi:hypothetical protein